MNNISGFFYSIKKRIVPNLNRQNILLIVLLLTCLLFFTLYYFTNKKQNIYVNNEKNNQEISVQNDDSDNNSLTSTAIENNENSFIYGNTNSNISNSGLVVQNGDWIYYSDYNNGGIYKRNINNSEPIKLTGDRAYYLNIKDGWIYYCNDSDNKKIYKIKNDGTDRTVVCKDMSEGIIIENDWIYYIGYSNTCGLYKIKTDGTGASQICNDIIESDFIAVSDDWIYYIKTDTNKIVDNHIAYRNLWRIKTDGSEQEDLIYDSCNYVNIVDDFIYYTNGNDNDNIYKAKIDGTDKEKLNNVRSYNLNVFNNCIYYENKDDNNKLYCINIDGTNNVELSDESNMMCINTTSQWLYYIDSINKFMFRMKYDSSNRELIGDEIIKDSNNSNNSNLTNLYTNSFFNFKIYYPSSWENATTKAGSGYEGIVLYSSGNNIITIHAQDNGASYSDWSNEAKGNGYNVADFETNSGEKGLMKEGTNNNAKEIDILIKKNNYDYFFEVKVDQEFYNQYKTLILDVAKSIIIL